MIRPRRAAAARPSSPSAWAAMSSGSMPMEKVSARTRLVEDLDPAVVEDGSSCDLREIAAEVRGVALGLEADEVEGGEAAGEALVLGQGGEDLRRREGDVQEEAHAALPARGAQLLAHEQEVVVVHPDGVVLAGEGGEEAGEAAVDRLVGGELGLVEMREVDAVVEDRPERAVGVAEIVALVLGRW